MREGRGRWGEGGSGAGRGEGVVPGGGRGGSPSQTAQPNRARAAADRPQRQSNTAPRSGIAGTNATTIDALFAPLQPVEGRGRLWLYRNKQLQMVNVRTGISDGQWTEILESGEAGQLEPGTDVVINVVTGLESAVRPGQQGTGSNNPLMGPQRGQRGGGPGGGGGRGR